MPGSPNSAVVRNIIFDLDGTLVDSLPGIEESARVAITAVLPEEPMPDLRSIIGPPVARMFAMLWPDLPEESATGLLAAFRSHYDETGCLRSQPYTGVLETLPRLSSAGMRMFVLTNKPLTPTRKILDHLGLAGFFAAVLTPDSEPPFKSKTAGARSLVEKFQLAPAETTLVGDGADDMEAAAACGFGFIAAAYGYGRAAGSATIRVEKFSEIEYRLLQPDSRL